MVATCWLGCGCVDRSLCLLRRVSTDAQAFEPRLELSMVIRVTYGCVVLTVL